MGHGHRQRSFTSGHQGRVAKDMPGLKHVHAVCTIDVHHFAGTAVIETTGSAFGFCYPKIGDLILSSHGGVPALIDGTGIDGDGTAIGTTHPAFGKAGHGYKVTIHTSHVHDEGAFVAISKCRGVGNAEAGGDPGSVGAVAHVIDEATSGIDICANGSSRGTRVIDLIHTGVSVAQEIAANIIHVRNVAFPIVTLSSTALIGGDAHGSGKPGIGGSCIPFIGNAAVDLRA